MLWGQGSHLTWKRELVIFIIFGIFIFLLNFDFIQNSGWRGLLPLLGPIIVP
jgi:hypothetical protein